MANRRKQLDEIQKRAGEFCEFVTGIRDEIEEAYNNMPESLKDSQRGQVAQERIDTLGEWIDYLDEMGEPIL